MKHLICLAAAAGLTGCGSLGALTGGPEQANRAEVLRVLGEHMDGCDRHYQGSLGLGASFTFNIDCRRREAAQP